MAGPPAFDLGVVADERLLELLAVQARRLALAQAQVWATMAEIAARDPFAAAAVPGRRVLSRAELFDSAVDEVRAELRLTRRGARREVAAAVAVAAVPRVAQALAAGRLDRSRALVLAEGCAELTEPQAALLLDELLPEAGMVTATGLAERVRRVAIALDPGWAERRYRQAVRERRVVGYLNRDGSATVSGQYLPAEQAAAACARVDALANAAHRAGAGAPVDLLRAELFLGLLDGRFAGLPESGIVTALLTQFPRTQNTDTAAAESRGDDGAGESESVAALDTAARVPGWGVELKVGLATLLGLVDQPGELAGWGPVTAAVARTIAAGQHKCEWRFAIVDAAGRVLFDGITRRRPTTPTRSQRQARGGIVEVHVPLALLTDPQLAQRHPAWASLLADLAAQYARQRPIKQDPAARYPGRPLRRRSQIIHQRCLFPGCRRPATGCDQDHRHDHARGGPTSKDNLAPNCRHDHMNKTRRGWRLHQRDPNTFTWISPLGRKHHVHQQPIAPPLPDPMPRNPHPPATGSDPDPPPF